MMNLIEYLIPEILGLITSEYFNLILVMFMVIGAINLVKKVLNI